MSRKVTLYLVIRADQSCRVVKRPNRLAADEVAIPLDLMFPARWGTILRERITVNVPDFVPEIPNQAGPSEFS